MRSTKPPYPLVRHMTANPAQGAQDQMKAKTIAIETAGLTYGLEFVAEVVTVGVAVAVYRKDREGRSRKVRQVNFDPAGLFASDHPEDEGPWADQVLRLIAQREREAEKQLSELLHKEQQPLPDTHRNGDVPHAD